VHRSFHLLKKTTSIRHLRRILLLYFYLILFSIASFLIVSLILSPEQLRNHIGGSGESPILATIVFIPIIEEFAFRLFITKKENEFIIGLSCLVSFLATLILLIFWDLGYLSLISLFVCFALIIHRVISRYVQKLNINLTAKHNLISLTLISSFIFAYSHFMINQPEILFSIQVFLLLPYFIRSLVYSYARVKFGLVWSILLHSLFNTSILLIQQNYT